MVEQEKPIVHQDSRWVFSGMVAARLVEVSHPGAWGGHRGQPQRLGHEDIQISFRKNQAASLVSGSFGSPLLVLYDYDSPFITRWMHRYGFRGSTVSIAGCCPIVLAMTVQYGLGHTSKLRCSCRIMNVKVKSNNPK